MRIETSSPLEILGGLSSISGSSYSDTDILYEFILSQEIVRKIDNSLDLEKVYSKPAWDPVFTIKKDAAIEEKLEFWKRKVRVLYDPGTGLIEVQVRSFDPDDSQMIAQEIFALSSDMINELSDIAREDAIRYAQKDLETSVERLKEARRALTLFRNETQIIDPTVDLQGQMGLLSSLQLTLAETLIEFDLLADSVQESDPRIEQLHRKIDVIRERIMDERQKLGATTGLQGEAYADLLGDFEALYVDREFAEKAYLAALSSYNSALAEANRKSRYLAAYIKPTHAEMALYPSRGIILSVLTFFAFALWATASLVAYSLKDRR